MAQSPWIRLKALLADVAEAAGGSNAFVFDAWGLVWCTALTPTKGEEAVLLSQVKSVLEGLSKPLERGGEVRRFVTTQAPIPYCHSFARTYVLAIWFDSPPDELTVRRAVRGAIAEIEALTLTLPPPGGPDATAGARGRRA